MKTMNETTERRQGGFTLIEMLLVILFLGILAAIALFGADAFGSRAREACSSNNARLERTVEIAANLGPLDAAAYYEVGPGDCEALGGREFSASNSRYGRPLLVVANHGAWL